MNDNDDWVLEMKQPSVFVSESSGPLPKSKTSDTAPAREQQKGSEEPAICDKADSAHIPPSYENVVGLHVACYENINFGSM